MDRNFRRLSYVRYADDFLIGVVGTHQEAVGVMSQVSMFLREHLGLDLNKSKTKLTHARKSKAYFLGTYISWNSNLDKKVVLRKRFGPQSRKKVRVQSLVQLNAPIDKLVNKLVGRGLLKWVRGKNCVWPTGLNRMINFDHADIV